MRSILSRLLGGGAMAVLASAVSMLAPPAAADVAPSGAMLRYPDASATQIVFSYAGNLWLAPREGGQATPLTSPSGREAMAKFSPDGQTIAFSGTYDGVYGIYTLPTTGGVPFRVTHHPAGGFVNEWSADGKDLIFTGSGYANPPFLSSVVRVSAKGGLPEPLPMAYGAAATLDPKGEWVAFTLDSLDFRTWKRYRGGLATDIWLYNLKTGGSKRATNWEGNDATPMWHGDKIYYLTDEGPEHRMNVWSLDPKSGARKQITTFDALDVKFPSIGPGPNGAGEIVFTLGSALMSLDLATGRSTEVRVTIPGDRPDFAERRVDMAENIASYNISNTGKRVLFEARGDVWSVPAGGVEGRPRNLTNTDGAAERFPAWSPDGKSVAYFSDATGEYELYVAPSDGRGEAKRLTSGSATYYFAARWSPDSKKISFVDRTGALWMVDAEGGEKKLVHKGAWSIAPHWSWSSDSNWIALSAPVETVRLWAVSLYNVQTGEATQVTAGRFSDTWPTFDRKGDFLYMASQRRFTNPTYDDLGETFIYDHTDQLVAIPLRKDVKSPFLAKDEYETWDDDAKKDEEKKGGDAKAEEKSEDDSADEAAEGADAEEASAGAKGEEKKDDEKKEEAEPLKIDLDGFESRAFLLPVDSGGFVSLSVTHDNKLVYQRIEDGANMSVKLFDMFADEPEEKTILSNAGGGAVPSADGKKLIVPMQGGHFTLDAAPGQDGGKKRVSTDGMVAYIDPRAEWKQIYWDGWRVYRDFFYDPNMHGVDWKAVGDRYAAMLDDCGTRHDVGYLQGEMIGELNVGHAYLTSSGDVEQAPSTGVGVLGADFEAADGAYRFKRIYEGAPWDLDARNPLREAGVDVNEGDYLLAVNGEPLSLDRDPWAAFVGTVGKTVELTVSSKPTIDDDARRVLVKPRGGDDSLRFRAWVEGRRAYVHEKTGGRVGYVYVPNTGVPGQNELVRQFIGEMEREALIVDERWNGGGQIPWRFIEILDRPAFQRIPWRDGGDQRVPAVSHQGPKCMLINGAAGSGGDEFPWLFRLKGLGKLIGTRTWGGLVGLSGNPGLVDGGYLAVPTMAFYEEDGTWSVEGHGVDPDIEVVDDPALTANGGDPQLDAAIEHMLAELKRAPYPTPKRPAYPNRAGFGIAEDDK